MEKQLNTDLELDKNEQDDLDTENSNDDYIQQPSENTPDQPTAPEQFSFTDGNKTLMLGSTKLNVVELCSLAIDFLGLENKKITKSKPSYTE